MKRIISLFLAFVMACVICGCSTGVPNNTQPSTQPKDDPEKQTEGSTAAPTDAATKPNNDEKVIQIPTKEIYFSSPAGWKVEEETKTLIVRESEDALVGIFYDWQTSAEGDLTDMVATYSAKFLRDISSYSKGYLRTSNIEVDSSKSGSVAGFDCSIFTGKASNDGEWDCHVYGYALQVDNVNLMIIGLVSTQAQDAEMISEIDATTDQIAASIRTEK